MRYMVRLSEIDRRRRRRGEERSIRMIESRVLYFGQVRVKSHVILFRPL